jgi:hypothetical protein
MNYIPEEVRLIEARTAVGGINQYSVGGRNGPEGPNLGVDDDDNGILTDQHHYSHNHHQRNITVEW